MPRSRGAGACSCRRSRRRRRISCAVPGADRAPRPDLADARASRSGVLPIGGYTLAITWAPQYCRDNARDAVGAVPVRQRQPLRLHAARAVARRRGQGLAAILRAAPMLLAPRRSAATCARRRRRSCSSTNGPSTAPAWACRRRSISTRSTGLYARAALSRHGRAVAAHAADRGRSSPPPFARANPRADART